MGNKLNHRRKLTRKYSTMKLAREANREDEGKERSRALKAYHKANRKASKEQLSQYTIKPKEYEEVDDPESV
jgi:hypothetical protein